MEQKDEIVEQAETLFNRYGIKSVSMDDVAGKTNISKKTLYQFFESKAELITQVLKKRTQEVLDCVMHRQKNESQSAIEEIFSHFHEMIKLSRNANPTLAFDLRKYYPGIYKYFKDLVDKHIDGDFMRNIKKGIEEGVYRKDLNIRLIRELHFNTIEHMSDPAILKIEPDFEKRYRTVLVYHLRAICTLKGLKQVENILKENEK